MKKGSLDGYRFPIPKQFYLEPFLKQLFSEEQTEEKNIFPLESVVHWSLLKRSLKFSLFKGF